MWSLATSLAVSAAVKVVTDLHHKICTRFQHSYIKIKFNTATASWALNRLGTTFLSLTYFYIYERLIDPLVI